MSMTLDPEVNVARSKPTPNPGAEVEDTKAIVAVWKEAVAEFTEPSRARAIWQIVSSFGAYALTWVAMYFAVQQSFWLALPLAVLGGGLLVRIFIIFHDCGHGSFFKSRKANDVWGFLAGMMTFTPYYHWRWEHSVHHAKSGSLEGRGKGDIWTLTVEEYLNSTRGRRFTYRLVRNPFILFVIAPVFVFLVRERWPSEGASPREVRSVRWMNLALLGVAVAMSFPFGFWTYAALQVTAMGVAASGGIWLFYVQHQYEDTYWESGDNWDYTKAALEGSSFYKLPRILQWFSGNIGFHHVHHLSPRVPNYRLQACHESHPLFRDVKPLTFWKSLKSATLHLWDEQKKKLVGFRAIRHLPRRKSVQE